jgi:hypothetical protein
MKFSYQLWMCLTIGTLGAISCDDAAVIWRNQTASLGGEPAGQRGLFRVLIINNTPFSPAFTVGVYEPTDRNSVPSALQFGPEVNRLLPGDTASDIFDVACARTFSVGGAEMLAFMRRNLDEEAFEVVDNGSFIEGVEFFAPQEDGEPSSAGLADGRDLLLGVDFLCNSLVIIRLEFSDVGEKPFRVEYDVIPSETTR